MGATSASGGQERDRSVLTLRLDPKVHRAIQVAAARTGKTVNQWATDVLAAAATTSNASWLLTELAVRGMPWNDAARDLTQAATRLILFTGLWPDGHGEQDQLIKKLESSIESAMGAVAIRAGKDAPTTVDDK